jgi:short-subunit dehydrogenase
MRELTGVPSLAQSDHSLPWLAAAGLSAVALFAGAKLAGKIRRPLVNLRGKIAVITGGSRGFGLAIAQELGEYGCRIALIARDPEELQQAANRLRSRGIDALPFPCDITRQGDIAPLVDRILQTFGRIDVLVNDAGLIKVARVENLEHSDFDEAMNLMFWAPVNLTLAVLPHMRRQGQGHIVNITSVGGRVAVPHLLAYSCAKFAFVGFSTGLSSELNPNEIHVLTVVPGLMRTGSYLNAAFKGDEKNEFAWFSILGNMPGFSVAAEDAAREVREALQHRALTRTISLPAKLLVHSEALIPELTRTAMQLTNEFLLPGPGKNRSEASGKLINSRFGAVFQALTALGRAAASALNE